MASGPSAALDREGLRRAQARQGDGLEIIAINDSWRLAPSASVLYGADAVWWRERGGVPDFRGLKIVGEPRGVAGFPEIAGIEVMRGQQSLETRRAGSVGFGGNSGFHAVNLAVQWGARRIVLVGFDYSLAKGVHWHGRHTGRLSNPTELIVRKWRQRLDATAPDLARLGIEVINTSASSALTAFPYRPLSEAIL